MKRIIAVPTKFVFSFFNASGDSTVAKYCVSVSRFLKTRKQETYIEHNCGSVEGAKKHCKYLIVVHNFLNSSRIMKCWENNWGCH
jgi:hypothetical protein